MYPPPPHSCLFSTFSLSFLSGYSRVFLGSASITLCTETFFCAFIIHGAVLARAAAHVGGWICALERPTRLGPGGLGAGGWGAEGGGAAAKASGSNQIGLPDRSGDQSGSDGYFYCSHSMLDTVTATDGTSLFFFTNICTVLGQQPTVCRTVTSSFRGFLRKFIQGPCLLCDH